MKKHNVEMMLSEIPAGFPRQPSDGSLAGIQPKLLVRKIGDRYVCGWTDEELRSRYDNCEDLAQQFAAYCRRKADEHPDWTKAFNMQRAAVGLAQKVSSGAWDVTSDEEIWIVSRFKKLLSW